MGTSENNRRAKFYSITPRGLFLGHRMKRQMEDKLLCHLEMEPCASSACAALSRTLTSLAYKASPWDPLTIAASALLLATVVVLSCSIPAKCAMSVDPMTTLREE